MPRGASYDRASTSVGSSTYLLSRDLACVHPPFVVSFRPDSLYSFRCDGQRPQSVDFATGVRYAREVASMLRDQANVMLDVTSDQVLSLAER